MVDLAAAWEWWRSLGRCGPGCGPADVFGKSLARDPTRVLPGHRGRPRQGACRGSRGYPRQGSCRGYSSSGYLSSLVCSWSSQRSACHHGGASRALVPMWLRALELSSSRVVALLALGKLPRQGSCRGCGGHPSKGLAGGVLLAPLLFVFPAWPWSGRHVPLLPLPRQAWPGAWGCDCPHISKGVQKGTPTFVHRHYFSKLKF